MFRLLLSPPLRSQPRSLGTRGKQLTKRRHTTHKKPTRDFLYKINQIAQSVIRLTYKMRFFFAFLVRHHPRRAIAIGSASQVCCMTSHSYRQDRDIPIRYFFSCDFATNAWMKVATRPRARSHIAQRSASEPQPQAKWIEAKRFAYIWW